MYNDHREAIKQKLDEAKTTLQKVKQLSAAKVAVEQIDSAISTLFNDPDWYKPREVAKVPIELHTFDELLAEIKRRFELPCPGPMA